MKRFLTSGLVFFVFLAGVAPVFAVDENLLAKERFEVLNRQISLFQEGLQSRPSDPELHFNLGTKYYELGRLYEKEAGRLFFTDENEKNQTTARELYRRSIDHLKESLKVQPRNAGAHFNLSLDYFVAGDSENAILHMRQAEQIFAELKDQRGVAKSRKALREWFDRYGYRPEDFDHSR